MNARIRGLQDALAKDGIDGALYATSANLQYLLNDTSFAWQRTPDTGGTSVYGPSGYGHFLYKPDCVLYVPASGEPVLLMTYGRAEDMKHIAVKQEVCYYAEMDDAILDIVQGNRIACGESCQDHLRRMLSALGPGMTVVEGEGLVGAMRRIKDSDEIAVMRRVAKLTDDAMAAVIPSLSLGKTPVDIQKLLAEYGRQHGAHDLPFAPTCHCTHTGAPSADVSGGYPRHQPIAAGTAIAFDFGYVMNGYCSDFGRSFYCGRPEESIADTYKALQEAQLHLLDIIKPGMRMDLTFKTLFSVMERRGCGKYLRNYGDIGLMGHQIGIDVHEHPWLHDKTEEVFEVGMIMCIEPKAWLPGKAYLRVEDMVLITEEGCESLTSFDRDLFELPG